MSDSVRIDSATMQAIVAAAVQAVLAAQSTPVQAPVRDLLEEANGLAIKYATAIHEIRKWTDANVDRTHTYRDLHALLGLRDGPAEPSQAAQAQASTPTPPPAHGVWDDPLVHSVNKVGRPRNAAGAFIPIARAIDPRGLLARYATQPGVAVK